MTGENYKPGYRC